MQLDQIIYHIANSPSLKLLGHENGPLALAFFFAVFKQENRLQMGYHELVCLLEAFMEEQQDILNIRSQGKARQYIDQWCDDRHRFLRKYYEANNDEPVTELTYESEQALEWLLSLDKKAFVGAESRFLSIFANLSNLAVKGATDPRVRLAHLQKERDAIDKEILAIKRTGSARSLSDVEIKERFLNTMEELRRLLSDFRLIEDIFKDLTRTIKAQVLTASSTKGAVLGQVLDVHDKLEESDQGKSFRSFWNFLMSEDKQRELRELSQRVLELDEIRVYTEEHAHRRHAETLLSMKAQLLQMGRKVLASQYRLSKELRRLLHHNAAAENQHVTRTIAAIKRLCLVHREALANRTHRVCVAIELNPDVYLPLERPLWRFRGETQFAERGALLAAQEQGAGDFKPLHTGMGVSLRELAGRINALTAERPFVNLSEVVDAFPVERGCGELLGYMMLALERPQHDVDVTQSVSVPFTGLHGGGTAKAPQITFRQKVANA